MFGRRAVDIHCTGLLLTWITGSTSGFDRSKGTEGCVAGCVKHGLSMSWSSKPAAKIITMPAMGMV